MPENEPYDPKILVNPNYDSLLFHYLISRLYLQEMDPIILSGLDTEKYRHPMETNAFERLRNTRGLQKIVNKFHEIGWNRI